MIKTRLRFPSYKSELLTPDPDDLLLQPGDGIGVNLQKTGLYVSDDEDPPQEKIDTINDEPDSDEEDTNADNFISNVSDIEGENNIA